MDVTNQIVDFLIVGEILELVHNGIMSFAFTDQPIRVEKTLLKISCFVLLYWSIRQKTKYSHCEPDIILSATIDRSN